MHEWRGITILLAAGLASALPVAGCAYDELIEATRPEADCPSCVAPAERFPRPVVRLLPTPSACVVLRAAAPYARQPADWPDRTDSPACRKPAHERLRPPRTQRLQRILPAVVARHVRALSVDCLGRVHVFDPAVTSARVPGPQRQRI